MTGSNWPAEWLRGVLTAAVLSIVSEGETYGYLVAQQLADAGLGVVKGGTLYPLLIRLEQDGHVVSTWREGRAGPGRKFYSITPAGRDRLTVLRADWQLFADRATAVIARGKADS
jgi:PadR family transcriptional regulator PadR